MKKVNFLVLLVLVCLLRAQELDYTKAPNSYIFEPTNPNSGLLIPVKKAYDMWEKGSHMGEQLIPSGVASAEVYWEDVHGLIKSGQDYKLEIIGSGKNAKIKVPVSKIKKGNALIVYKVDGTIYWSWHVWVTDDPSNGSTYMAYQQTSRERKDGKIEVIPPNEWGWMDRNLGAISNSLTEEGWNRNNGLLYQWGRKDPIPPLNSKVMDFYEVSGSVGRVTHYNALNYNSSNVKKLDNLIKYVPFSSSSPKNNIRLAVQNPLSLIYVNEDNSHNQAYYVKPEGPVNWFGKMPISNGSMAEINLWSDNSKGTGKVPQSYNGNPSPYRNKSSYDPCPNGWRVPSVLVADRGNWGYQDDIRIDFSPFGFRSDRWNFGFKESKSNIIKPTDKDIPSYMKGMKVYPSVGVDATSVGGYNMGVFPGTGLLSRFTQGGRYTDGHEVYLWTATMTRWYDNKSPAVAARALRIVPDMYQSDIPDTNFPNVQGRFEYYPLNHNMTSDAMGVRCIKDPLYIVNDYNFPTEYFKDEISFPTFLSGIDNPNSYQIVKKKTESIIEIPINKAFSVQSEYLNNKSILKNINYNNLRVNVLWTTNIDLVKQVSISNHSPRSLQDIDNTTIKVRINPNQTGNAVVTLHNGSIKNPVYWSWHIWVTDSEVNSIRYVTDEPDKTAYNYINYVNKGQVLDTEFMDRNLGAESAFPTVLDINKPSIEEQNLIKKSGGLQYQWGRKDPIPSFTNPDGSVYDIYLGNVHPNGTITYSVLSGSIYNSPIGNYIKSYNTYSTALSSDKISEKVSKNLSYSVSNPLIYMIPSKLIPPSSIRPTYNNGTDWLVDEVNMASDRWGRGDKKSPFDPCPEGWRIPDVTNVDITAITKTNRRDYGMSPWARKNSYIGDGHNIITELKGSIVKNNNVIIGVNFNHNEYSVGNYPFTGIRGYREVMRNSSENYYGINSNMSGFWLGSFMSNYTGRPIGMTIDRTNNHMYSFNNNIDPYFAMNCRCVKVKYTLEGKQEGAYPRMPIPRYIAAKYNKLFSNDQDKLKVQEKDNDLKLYPNPVENILMIEGNMNDAYYFQIYDFSTGNIVIEGKFVNNQVDLSRLKGGIYLIRINNSNTVMKFIKK